MLIAFFGVKGKRESVFRERSFSVFGEFLAFVYRYITFEEGNFLLKIPLSKRKAYRI